MKHRPPQPGFTLIEILVAISIIALIAALSIAVAARMMTSGKRGATSTMLGQLAGVLTEYQVQTGGTSPDPTDTNRIKLFVSEVLSLGDGNPAERMLRSINESYWDPGIYDYANLPVAVADYPTIIDAWGTPIEYIASNGTNDLLTSSSNQQPPQQQPYFGSAGPDGEWGEWVASGTTFEPDALAKDNLYSFQIGE